MIAVELLELTHVIHPIGAEFRGGCGEKIIPGCLPAQPAGHRNFVPLERRSAAVPLANPDNAT
jgi:hypothetical protein